LNSGPHKWVLGKQTYHLSYFTSPVFSYTKVSEVSWNFVIFFFFWLLRQGLILYPRLALNLPSSCLSLLSLLWLYLLSSRRWLLDLRRYVFCFVFLVVWELYSGHCAP
jgi:hypothetical protein